MRPKIPPKIKIVRKNNEIELQIRKKSYNALSNLKKLLIRYSPFNRQSFKSGAISQIEEGAAIAFNHIKTPFLSRASLISHEGNIAYYDPIC